MEQLGSHGTDFHEICYLSIFRKFVEKIQVSLNSNNNNGYFTWRPIYIFYVSLVSSLNEKFEWEIWNDKFEWEIWSEKFEREIWMRNFKREIRNETFEWEIWMKNLKWEIWMRDLKWEIWMRNLKWEIFNPIFVENQKTNILYSKIFFAFVIRAVYEVMWKNTVERSRPQIAIRRMRIACRIPKATNTHSEYVILIALPQQQWLHERAWMLLYTYIACIVIFF